YFLRKPVIVLLCIVLPLSLFISLFPNLNAPASIAAEATEGKSDHLNLSFKKSGYDRYILDLQDKSKPEDVIVIPAASYVEAEGMEPELLTNYMGFKGVSVKTDET